MTISHFTGCLWFAIGARDTSDSTWVQVGGYTTQGRKWDDEMEKIGREVVETGKKSNKLLKGVVNF